MRKRKKIFWRYAGCGLLVTGGILACLFYQTHLISLGYAMGQMDKEKKELERLHAEYQIEIASLASLERIERIAVGRLGMSTVEVSRKIMVAEKDRTGNAPAMALAERETSGTRYK